MAHTSEHFFEPYDPDFALEAYAECADFDRFPEQLEQPPIDRPLPGQIGGVAVQLSFLDRLSDHPRLFDPDLLEDSPEAIA